MPRYNDHEESAGYEDPAQRPESRDPEVEEVHKYRDPEKRPGRWAPGTLFIMVVVVLLAGLGIMALLGVLA